MSIELSDWNYVFFFYKTINRRRRFRSVIFRDKFVHFTSDRSKYDFQIGPMVRSEIGRTPNLDRRPWPINPGRSNRFRGRIAISSDRFRTPPPRRNVCRVRRRTPVVTLRSVRHVRDRRTGVYVCPFFTNGSVFAHAVLGPARSHYPRKWRSVSGTGRWSGTGPDVGGTAAWLRGGGGRAPRIPGAAYDGVMARARSRGSGRARPAPLRRSYEWRRRRRRSLPVRSSAAAARRKSTTGRPERIRRFPASAEHVRRSRDMAAAATDDEHAAVDVRPAAGALTARASSSSATSYPAVGGAVRMCSLRRVAAAAGTPVRRAPDVFRSPRPGVTRRLPSPVGPRRREGRPTRVRARSSRT